MELEKGSQNDQGHKAVAIPGMTKNARSLKFGKRRLRWGI